MFYNFTNTQLIVAGAALALVLIVMSLLGTFHSAEPEPAASARVSDRSMTAPLSPTDPRARPRQIWPIVKLA